jgi:hypothetical protein
MSQTKRNDHYIVLLCVCFFLITLFSGCAKKFRLRTTSDECAPANLEVKSNDQTLFLKWDTNCPKESLLSGYYIYLEDKPIYAAYHNLAPPRGIKPLNHDPYPGDTDPEDRWETMEINNLDNGIEYYVSIRALYPDRTVSVSSNEVIVMCRPEGTFELAFRYSDLNDGHSFADDATVRADGETNDLYFYHKDGFDFIASPHRLNGFLRKSFFYSLGKTENIYQYPKLDLDFQPVEKMPVHEGESYLIETADNNFAKVRIENITGEGKKRRMKINYIYQTIKGQMRF